MPAASNWSRGSVRNTAASSTTSCWSRRNLTHIWKPLLHEVAAGSLDANLDEVGYRSHCHRWGYRFFYGAMESIDRAAREIVVAPLIDEDGRELIGRHRTAYDYLVIAIGSITNDFTTPGVAQNCLFLDDRVQADRFRNKLLNHCLRVSRALSENPAAEQFVRLPSSAPAPPASNWQPNCTTRPRRCGTTDLRCSMRAGSRSP